LLLKIKPRFGALFYFWNIRMAAIPAAPASITAAAFDSLIPPTAMTRTGVLALFARLHAARKR
jgi:hypothetical protein